MKTPFDIENRTIFLTVSGSHAYGMARPESDIDVRGICIPPKKYFLGTFSKFEQFQGEFSFEEEPFYLWGKPVEDRSLLSRLKEISGRVIERNEKIDLVIYDLRKFFSLAAKCNPNILELLFVDEDSFVKTTSFYDTLRDNRQLFLSKKAKYSFFGYALSQLKRIRTHRNWLLNPPSHKPTREEFGLENRTMLPKDQLRGAFAYIKKQVDKWLYIEEELPRNVLESIRTSTVTAIAEMWQGLSKGVCPVKEDGYDTVALERAASVFLGFDDNFIQYLEREKYYTNALNQYKSWVRWKKERNAARSELEAKAGYDTKHASHLIRLLRMAEELGERGEVLVRRPDAEELLAIRAGAWSYDELMEKVDALKERVEEIFSSPKNVLPQKPDTKKIEELAIKLTEQALEDLPLL